MNEQTTPAIVDRNAPPIDRYVFEIDGGVIVLVCLDCGVRAPGVKGLIAVNDSVEVHDMWTHNSRPHNPNACCDFHRNIADGCCHCGDDAS